MIITNTNDTYRVEAQGYTLTASASSFAPEIGGVAICALDVRTPVCITENGEEKTDLADRIGSFELLESNGSEAHFVWRGVPS